MIISPSICAVVLTFFLAVVSSAALYITYDKQSSTRCNPTSACKGIDIRQIPFILDHVTENFANSQEFYDTEGTSSCLRNKRLVLLGDSTMIEFANDLAILLSGVASDRDALEKYLFRTTRVSAGYAQYDLPNHVSEDYYGNHRNMTIYSRQLNIQIRMRYIGHANLNKEDMGVRSLLEKSFQPELMCLLGFNGCPVPDYAIINSGYHDRSHPVKHFKKVLFYFLHDLCKKYKKLNLPTEIIWAGTIIATSKWDVIVDLDEMASKVMMQMKIPYVNGTEVFQYVPMYMTLPKLYTPDYMHFGSVAKLYNSNITGAVSMLKTQRLLDELCHHKLKHSTTVRNQPEIDNSMKIQII